MNIEHLKSFEELILFTARPNNGLLQVLRENSLVKKRRMCCGRVMREFGYGAGPHLGKVWRCRLCKAKVPTLKGSFFEGSRLHPPTILKVVHAYLVNKINYDGISMMMTDAPKSTNLTDWLQFCRDLLSKALLGETQGVKLGGPGKVVVVDETALAKRKYHRGRPMARECIWVLGMYDVEAKVGQVVWIQNRSHDQIIPQYRGVCG